MKVKNKIINPFNLPLNMDLPGLTAFLGNQEHVFSSLVLNGHTYKDGAKAGRIELPTLTYTGELKEDNE